MNIYLPTKLNRLDTLLVISLLLIVVIWAMFFVNFSTYPSEDAAMLMRYSKHVAQGEGIVWNIGEKPTGGVTDFLFMLFVAALAKMKLSLEQSVRLIGFSSHVLTVVFIYLAIRTLHNSRRWIAFVCAGYLAIGPGLQYLEVYFGTPLFALSACITWWLANSLIGQNNSRFLTLSFALSSLAMGLVRPEGVFLALFILLAVVYVKGIKQSSRIILYFLGVFILLGGSYFFWLWNHSGYPLPNSFYIKGRGYLYLDSLVKSIRNALILTFPFCLVFIYVLIKRSSRAAKQIVFPLIPIIGFVSIWVLLSNAMNYRGRFQYPILPIILMSCPPLLTGILDDLNLSREKKLKARQRLLRFGSVLVIAGLWLGLLLYQYRRHYSSCDGRYDVAIMLKEYSHKDYIMATTEAGLLPFYSGWKAIDAVGLNDQWIAHNGGITKGYLDRYRPEIIMFHAFFSPLTPHQERTEVWYLKWQQLVSVLKSYAEESGYILAASFGCKPDDTHYYYVKPGFPESSEIVKGIRKINYCWWENSKKCINYAK